MITLNAQQEEAENKIKDWYDNINATKKQIFVLNGPAGTGKTTVINHVIENVFKFKEYEVAFATPTGKAASILLQKGSFATTVHRLIYTPVVSEQQIKKDDNTEVKKKKIKFVKKSLNSNYKIIVLDEVSMINKHIMDDLLSYNIPILATGDDAQLPAVASESSGLLQNPDYTLTEVVRQAKDNNILKVATLARTKQFINYGSYGNDVLVLNKNTLPLTEFNKYLLEADQVICGKNETRRTLNSYIRKLKGYTKITPEDGEKVFCNLNNYQIVYDDKYPLVNGMCGYVKDFTILDDELKLAKLSFKPDFLDDDKYATDLIVDYQIFITGTPKYDLLTSAYILPNNTFAIKEKNFKQTNEENKEEYLTRIRKEYINSKKAEDEALINQFDYGYVCSCHKSQGSEWNYVVVIDESSTFKNDKYRWLYTACTRAKKKLIIVK